MKFIGFLVALVFAMCAFETVTAYRVGNCETACPAIYQPLCGRDLYNVERSFPNDCSMRYANCNEGASFVKVRSGLC